MTGKLLRLEHAEIDFSSDISFKETSFEVWVYNPADLPNKVLYEKTIYKNMKDLIKIANTTEVVAGIDDITNSIYRFVFEYPQDIVLKASEGAELRISVKDDEQMSGEFGSATLYTIEEDE